MDAKPMNKRSLRVHTLWLLFLTANAALAADAGQVIFAKGAVTAERQPPVPLAKGDAVLVEDTVATGEASRAQLLMVDGAKIAIRPNSRLRIEEYAFPSGETAAPGQAVVTTSDDRSVTSLLKGGFRTITGAIGKDNEDSYEVRTAVGVLGIRGTSFGVLLCTGDCGYSDGARTQPVEDGLYIGVTEGIVFFRNEFGEIEIRAGEFVFVPLSDRRARRLQTPPALLLDDQDLEFDPDGSRSEVRPDDDMSGAPDDDDTGRPPGADGSSAAPTDPDGSGTGFNARFSTRRVPESGSAQPQSSEEDDGSDSSTEPPQQSIIGTDPDGTPVDITPGDVQPGGNRTISYSTGPLGAVDTFFSGVQDDAPGEFRLDQGNNVIGFIGPYPGRAADAPADFDLGSSGNVETGFDSVTVLRWGRWSGGTANITLMDGTDASQDLGNQSIHWISGPENGAPPTMPISGVANYSLVGNTSPTDNLGNVGILGSATFSADFTRQIVDSTLVLDIAGANWSAAGNGTIGAMAGLPAHLFSGIYSNVAITGPTGTILGTGVFSGFFSAPGPGSDPTYPGGAGVTYSLSDPQSGSAVSGALAFGNPQ
jgi:hypothetical protein